MPTLAGFDGRSLVADISNALNQVNQLSGEQRLEGRQIAAEERQLERQIASEGRQVGRTIDTENRRLAIRERLRSEDAARDEAKIQQKIALDRQIAGLPPLDQSAPQQQEFAQEQPQSSTFAQNKPPPAATSAKRFLDRILPSFGEEVGQVQATREPGAVDKLRALAEQNIQAANAIERAKSPVERQRLITEQATQAAKKGQDVKPFVAMSNMTPDQVMLQTQKTRMIAENTLKAVPRPSAEEMASATIEREARFPGSSTAAQVRQLNEFKLKRARRAERLATEAERAPKTALAQQIRAIEADVESGALLPETGQTLIDNARTTAKSLLPGVEQFRTVFDDNGNPIFQESTKTGKRFAFPDAPKLPGDQDGLSEAEKKIKRLVDLGIPLETATKITSGVVKLKQSPDTGDLTITDLATGESEVIVPKRQESPESGLDQDAFAGPTLWDQAEDATGAVASLKSAATNTLGQFADPVGEAFTFPKVVKAKTDLELALRNVIQTLSLSKKFPVTEANRLRGLLPSGPVTSEATLKGSIGSMDGEMARLEAVAKRQMIDPNIAAKERQIARQSHDAIKVFRKRLGFPGNKPQNANRGIGNRTKLPSITEADIQHTMKIHGLTRKEVLERLK